MRRANANECHAITASTGVATCYGDELMGVIESDRVLLLILPGGLVE